MDDEWLTDDELDGPQTTELKEINKRHYIHKSDRDKCYNTDCPVTFVFPSLRRPHHCKRCGEVFCRNCLQYRRKLNMMAKPDPEGIPCRVCLRCYTEREAFLEGVRRSHVQEYLRMRSDYREEKRKLVCDVTIEIKKADTIPSFWKEQFEIDIPKECQRLLDGFAEEIGSSETLKTLEELHSLVTIPYWQKSTYWQLEKSTTSCRKCKSNIGARIRKKRNCRVCGLALCKKCSYKELLLYYDDGPSNRATCSSRLAIIRVDGCPEVEPKYSLLLYICAECKKYITDQQVINSDWFIKKPKQPDVTSQLEAIDTIFRDLVEEIETRLKELEDNVNTTKTEDRKQNRRCSVFGLVQSLHEIDTKRDRDKSKQTMIDDIQQKLWRYYSLFTKLRNVRQDNKDVIGNGLTKLLNNYIKCRNDYYIQTKSKITAINKLADGNLEPNHL